MKKYVLLIILPTLIGTSLFTGCAVKNNKNENAIQVEEVNKQNSIYLMAGMIETDNQVNVSSKISARVSDVLVNVGSTVNQGDAVITLDTQDLQAQVDQAQAAVNTANANLNNAMNSTRPEQISQAQATLDSAKATYDVAKKNYDRTKALVDASAATEVQLETAQQQLTSAESGQKSAEEQLEMLKNGATETSIDVYKAQVHQAEEAVKTAQVALNNGTITAPISGNVTVKNINKGEMAAPGSTLISISNPDALCVNAYAPLRIVKDLKEGQTVAVKVYEIEDSEFEGTISVINSTLNSQNSNVLVKIVLTDSKGQLKPGMFAEVGIKG
ncbi:MAG: efflux RND transporter periplasmic adaptor subunit [Clostridium beijerinckii]|jgi:multidrug resistance efflux pump|uniref:Secretion protein HlyD n=1 Tax=Clostridium diolis TaxID=223919 RepID=A0AAV3VX43_9CLOT|nr:efflux RND transporter periplasmic adaptor subunit [Clostridium diolis]MCI1580295.1 efflux RND transporter periplasmic adaptor subunit [Clostridium beijerinckii]MCI1583149.1 efflux RND transporter periplasmic adaptor subunit [Clostridium beijerinckii]MCI1623295.1 efflux RND transporter periplasmic adaptor subunit [Clostridium beijerinckii]QES74029.1 HlyD family efflux transporter periplasmic adaptor subunit [Clostridium diolis]GEA30560.1 secretion protein HlyD [Clostridium diolis]